MLYLEAEHSEKIRCDTCGAFIDADLEYCPYCGAAIVLWDLCGMHLLGGLML